MGERASFDYENFPSLSLFEEYFLDALHCIRCTADLDKHQVFSRVQNYVTKREPFTIQDERNRRYCPSSAHF